MNLISSHYLNRKSYLEGVKMYKLKFWPIHEHGNFESSNKLRTRTNFGHAYPSNCGPNDKLVNPFRVCSAQMTFLDPFGPIWTHLDPFEPFRPIGTLWSRTVLYSEWWQRVHKKNFQIHGFNWFCILRCRHICTAYSSSCF